MNHPLDKVWNLRAETLQAALPARSIDLVLADATYGIGTKYHWGREPKNPEDNWRLLGPIYRDWFRLLRPSGHVVCFQATSSGSHVSNVISKRFRYQEFFSEWFGEWSPLMVLKWTPAGVRYAWFPEQAIVQTAERKKVNLPQDTFLVCYGAWDDYIPHRCFKPLEGIKAIIEMLTKPGDVVLDPFCGSGTTAVACKMTGRHFIVGDMWPAYTRTTLERLAWAEHGQSPYGGREGKGDERRYFYRNGGVVPG
jgi:site-specific DNA-methyltransferase (adenine-specific)